MQHDPRASLADMRQAAKRAMGYVGRLSFEEFVGDEEKCWAVFGQFVIVGEAARRIPREWQDEHPIVRWSRVIGMRHRMVHDYDDIDWQIAFDTVMDDFPELVGAIDEFLGRD